MKKQSLIVTLLTVVLTAGLLQAEEQPAEELSNTRYAAVELRITSDLKMLPIDTEKNFNRLLDGHLTEHADTVSEEVFRKSEWRDFFDVRVVGMPMKTAGLQTVYVVLTVTLTDKQKPVAKEFLEAYIEKLRSALQKEYDTACELHRKKLRVYMQRKDQSEMNLHNLLEAQGNLSGGSGKLDKESVRQRILEHERAKIENGLQQSILRKRVEELVKQIEEAHRTTDEIAAVREAILGLMSDRDHLRTEYKEIDFKRKQYAENDPGGSHEKIVELTSKLSDVETNINRVEREIDKLSKHEKQLESQTAGDIQELNRQLRETTMQLEELEIQETILYGYSPGRISDSIEYEMLEVRIEAAKENLRRAILDTDEAALQLDLLQPPTVSYDEIISSETVPDSEYVD